MIQQTAIIPFFKYLVHKMDVLSLLNQLSDGEFHSGSSLGKSLGVSRAAIWKALTRLSELNLNIETIKGKGYRLSGGLDLLGEKEIFQNISIENKGVVSMDLMLSVESTNSWLMSKEQLSAEYEICTAEMQKLGKGRRGKVWISPFGKNIYLSAAFDLQGGVEALNGLSLVVGLAVIRVLKALGIHCAVLKWPNDIWINSRKAGGILVELKGEATTGWRVVVGVGLNVHMDKGHGKDIDQPWVSLAEFVSCTRNQVTGLLIDHLVDVLSHFKSHGFEYFMEEWEESDFLKGKAISFGGAGITGVAAGINSQGALLVETVEGLKVMNAGEVSVRPM